MKTQMNYWIDENLKNDFDEFILNKYETKHGKYSLELGKAMKLQLALNGNEKYINDQDVQKLRDTISEKSMTTHTQKENKVGTQNNENSNDKIEKIEKENKEIKNELKEIKQLLIDNIKIDNLEKENQRYTDNLPNTLVNKTMNKDEMILNDFINTYGNQNQVSKNDLTKLIMNKGLTNKQTINNKIQFLESKGVINPINPMVFNVTGINGK